MSNLFTNYQNINPNYEPSNIKPAPNPCKPKLEPCKPNKPYEEYDAENKLVGYYWNYGDTINLEFDVSGEVTIIDGGAYIQAVDFLIGKYAVMTIYDFRGDVMATQKLYTSTTLQRNSVIKAGSIINGVTYKEDTIVGQAGFMVEPNSIIKAGSIINGTEFENDVEITDENGLLVRPNSIIKANSNINGVFYENDITIGEPSSTITKQSILKVGSKLVIGTTINNKIYEEETVTETELTLYPGTRILFEIDKELSNKLIKGVYTCTLILYDENNSYVDTLFSQQDGKLIVK